MAPLKPYHCPSCDLHFSGKDGYRNYSSSRYPLLLKCGHTFCENCINSSFKTHKNFTCKICDEVTQFEPGVSPVSKLLPDIYAIGIINSKGNLPSLKNKLVPASPMKNDKNGTLIPCEHCSMREAAFHCKTCEENFCNICFDSFHNLTKKRKRHVPYPVYANKYQTLIQEGCSQHGNRPIEFYCVEDNDLACSHCVIGGIHQGHQVVTLAEKNQSLMEDLKKTLDEVKEFSKRLKFSKKKFMSEASPEKTDCSNWAKEIKLHFHSLHSKLIMREHSLLQQLDDIANANLNLTSKLQQELSDADKDVDAVLRDAQSVLDNPSVPISVPEIIKKLEAVKDYPCHVLPVEDNGPNDHLNFGLTFDTKLHEAIANHGKISADVKPKFCLKSINDLPSGYIPEPLPIDTNTMTDETGSIVSDCFSEDSLATNYEKETILPPTDKYKSSSSTGKLERVAICYIHNPTHFYVRKCSDNPKLETIQRLILRHLRLNPDASFNKKLCEEGNLCLAQFTLDNKWYRARLIKHQTDNKNNSVEENNVVSSDNNVVKAKVVYIDFGNSEVLPISRIIPFPKELARYPDLVRKCSLHNIVPAKSDAWTEEAIEVFQNFVFNKEVNMHVIEEQKDTLYIDLSPLASGSAVVDVPVSVRDALIFLEHATFFNKEALPKSKKKVQKFRQFLPPERINANTRVMVNITYIESPYLFYVQLLSTARVLSELIVEMQRTYSEDPDISKAICVPYVGMICAAQFPEDKMWYRAEVLSLPGGTEVEVEFVDFGYKHVLSYSFLKPIPDVYIKLTKQAIPCTLTDISFKDGTVWPEDAIQWLSKYTQEKRFSLLSLGYEPNCSKTRVVLFDVENETETCINALMVKEGLAVGTGLYATAIQKRITKPKTPPKSNYSDAKEIKTPVILDKSPPPKDIKPFKINSKKSPSKPKDHLKVIVTHIDSPGLFFIRMCKEEPSYKKLLSDMEAVYKDLPPYNDAIEIEKEYAVYQDEDKLWYRGFVLSLENENTLAEVKFPDIGCIKNVCTKNLHPLLEEFSRIKVYAIPCYLTGILPAGDNQNWSSIAIEKFRDLVRPYDELYLVNREQDTEGDRDTNMIPSDLLFEEIIHGGALEPSTYNYVSITQLLIEAGVVLPVRKKKLQIPSPVSNITIQPPVEDPLKPYVDRIIEVSKEKIPEPTSPLLKWKQPLLPKVTEFIGYPTHVGDDGCIYIQTLEGTETAEMIQKALYIKYQNFPPKPLRICPPIGTACLAEFELDHKYYRAEIFQMDPDRPKVQFVDYGNYERIPVKKIILDDSYIQIPRLCVECELADVTPPLGQWPTDVLNLMHEHIVEKKSSVQVIEPMESGKRLKILMQVGLQGESFNDFVSNMFVKPKAYENGNCFSDSEDVDYFPDATDLRTDRFIPIVIPNVIEPNLVYIQCLSMDDDDDRKKEIDQFLLLMKHLAENAENFDKVSCPYSGMACVGKFSVDKSWYRCKILSVDECNANVLYVDYGNYEIVPLNNLREPDSYTLNFPIQAHLCKISSIEPTDNNWASVSHTLLNRYLSPSSQMFAKVIDKPNIYTIEIYTQNSDGQYSVLYEDLIHKGILKMV